MSTPSSFDELIQKVRQGDQEAASQLVKQYEPAIRRSVRLRIGDSRLQSAFDSMDVCQSVMASFFVRAASGQFELESAEELLKLLTRMARNKLSMQVRKQRAAKRDNRRVVSGGSEEHGVAAAASTPSQQISARELLQEVQRRLSPEERQLVELRNDGVEWGEIAQQLNGSPEALRKKLARAIDRVSNELGMTEELET